jgi:hypothetical protein
VPTTIERGGVIGLETRVIPPWLISINISDRTYIHMVAGGVEKTEPLSAIKEPAQLWRMKHFMFKW